MSIYSLSGVYPPDGPPLNGWHGYTTERYVKQWYFIEDVPLGFVTASAIHPSPVLNSFGYSFANKYSGSLPDLDTAKTRFKEVLADWFRRNPTTLPNSDLIASDLP